MKKHHIGPLSFEAFMACFPTVEAVETYETVLAETSHYPASTREHLQVQIDRPDDGGFMIRIFSSIAPKVTLFAMSDTIQSEALAS